MNYARKLLWAEIFIHQLVSYVVVATGLSIDILTIFSIDYPLDKIFKDKSVLALWSNGHHRLNREQTQSLRTAVKNKFQLIQGPPGNKLYCINDTVCMLVCICVIL